MVLKEQAKKHVEEKILPFWKNLKDEDFGGYYGLLDFELRLDKFAVKGMILNSRILWFFSNATKILKKQELKEYAKHAYEFLVSYGVDASNGGVFWSLNYDGAPYEDVKYTYNQAFAIYALCAYYEIEKDEKILDLAFEIFHVIESKCKDEEGYLEAFYRDYTIMPNEQLSENGVIADRTMNTLLHVMEAYTQLYKITKSEQVKQCLVEQLSCFEHHIYDSDGKRQHVFFDKDWNPIIDLQSYGHDIESSWLIDECLEILDDEELNNRLSPITRALAESVYERAYHDHSLWNECENGENDKKRIWWVQAETVVGFLNAYQKCPQKQEYYEASKNTLQFIFERMIDEREGSEWYSELDDALRPIEKSIVDPWKCPYHNGRMCLELIERNVICPVNKKASKEAVLLLNYLQSVRGKGLITGQHTQTNPMEEKNFIYELTGKYPALLGFELLAYSPNVNRITLDEVAKKEVDENRGTILRALEWGKEKKGIVTFSWHWFSPLYGENKSFYAEHTSFDPREVLKEGTPERNAFYADMESMAKELEIFQVEKIPVLWRPFHESYGTWFWWGRYGNQVARDLYILMFNYFVEECKLHNLLWVWNSDAPDSYPGDDFVDVVSVDIYLEKPSPTDYWEQLYKLKTNTSMDKIASLAEVGMIPDIHLIEKNRPDWVYYMVWSKEFAMTEQYAPFKMLKDMYQSDYAITYDKLPWINV